MVYYVKTPWCRHIITDSPGNFDDADWCQSLRYGEFENLPDSRERLERWIQNCEAQGWPVIVHTPLIEYESSEEMFEEYNTPLENKTVLSLVPAERGGRTRICPHCKVNNVLHVFPGGFASCHESKCKNAAMDAAMDEESRPGIKYYDE